MRRGVSNKSSALWWVWQAQSVLADGSPTEALFSRSTWQRWVGVKCSRMRRCFKLSGATDSGRISPASRWDVRFHGSRGWSIWMITLWYWEGRKVTPNMFSGSVSGFGSGQGQAEILLFRDAWWWNLLTFRANDSSVCIIFYQQPLNSHFFLQFCPTFSILLRVPQLKVFWGCYWREIVHQKCWKAPVFAQEHVRYSLVETLKRIMLVKLEVPIWIFKAWANLPNVLRKSVSLSLSTEAYLLHPVQVSTVIQRTPPKALSQHRPNACTVFTAFAFAMMIALHILCPPHEVVVWTAPDRGSIIWIRQWLYC